MFYPNNVSTSIFRHPVQSCMSHRIDHLHREVWLYDRCMLCLFLNTHRTCTPLLNKQTQTNYVYKCLLKQIFYWYQYFIIQSRVVCLTVSNICMERCGKMTAVHCACVWTDRVIARGKCAPPPSPTVATRTAPPQANAAGRLFAYQPQVRSGVELGWG